MGAKRERGRFWKRVRRPLGAVSLQILPSLGGFKEALCLLTKACPASVQRPDNGFTAGMLTRPAGRLPSSSGSLGAVHAQPSSLQEPIKFEN